ncbi:MAG: nucleotidyltransferase domain-containing protein, partial [Luteolibacter sp.]
MSQQQSPLEKRARDFLKAAVKGQLSPSEQTEMFKQFLGAEESRIREMHQSGAGGIEVARARSELIDTILRNRLLTSSAKRAASGGATPKISLVATGGYGRGLLNPRSDIDLLFLLPRASNKLPKSIQELVQEILYLLWDVGFKVGHACRSIGECIAEARADQENKTALMDSRLVAGDAELFSQFTTRFAKECIDKGQQAFFELRSQDLKQRHAKYSHTVFLQEPNVKEGCGAMRDYQCVQWVARVKQGSSDLSTLVKTKLLTPAAF